MRKQRLTDEANVTHVDLSPLRSVLLTLVVGLFVLVGFAMKGNDTAELLLVALGVAALITLGIILSNSVRHSNARARSAEAEIEQEAWRLNQEENAALLREQAQNAILLGLATQRTTRAALMAGEQTAEEDNVPAIVAGDDIFDQI